MPARERIIDEAMEAASEAGDPNRVVTVSAWPMKVLAISGRVDRVTKEVDRLIKLIGTELSPVRRADALRYLFGAVISGQKDVTVRVIEALVSACLEPLLGGRRSRKGESLLSECLPAIARIDQRIASDVVSACLRNVRRVRVNG